MIKVPIYLNWWQRNNRYKKKKIPVLFAGASTTVSDVMEYYIPLLYVKKLWKS